MTDETNESTSGDTCNLLYRLWLCVPYLKQVKEVVYAGFGPVVIYGGNMWRQIPEIPNLPPIPNWNSTAPTAWDNPISFQYS